MERFYLNQVECEMQEDSIGGEWVKRKEAEAKIAKLEPYKKWWLALFGEGSNVRYSMDCDVDGNYYMEVYISSGVDPHSEPLLAGMTTPEALADALMKEG